MISTKWVYYVTAFSTSVSRTLTGELSVVLGYVEKSEALWSQKEL